MKRSEFFKSIMLGGVAAVAAPLAVSNKNEMEKFVHIPMDYTDVPEEAEELQEYEVDVPEDWAEEEIVWI